MAKKKQIAGEAVVVQPINEEKVTNLILKMVPEVKGDNLQNVIVNLLTEYDRLKRNTTEVKAQPEKPMNKESEILEAIKRLEGSLQQVKEQFSIMRQYGIGAVAGR